MCWLDQVQLSRRVTNLLQIMTGLRRRGALPQCSIPLPVCGLLPCGCWLPLVVRFGALWVWLALFGALCGRGCCSCGSLCSCRGGGGFLGLPGCRCLGFLFSCCLFLCLTAAFLCGTCGCFCLSRGFSFLLGRSLLRPVCCFGFCILRALLVHCLCCCRRRACRGGIAASGESESAATSVISLWFRAHQAMR